MKIAFDVDVIKDLGITQMVEQVADWDYKCIEQSLHPQINPFYKHPKAGREVQAEYQRALKATGVEISSFGEGEVDFATLFQTLRDMEFANRTFKVGGESIICTSLFGYPERMPAQTVATRECIEKELLGK